MVGPHHLRQLESLNVTDVKRFPRANAGRKILGLCFLDLYPTAAAGADSYRAG
jgi:hypothetical protein